MNARQTALLYNTIRTIQAYGLWAQQISYGNYDGFDRQLRKMFSNNGGNMMTVMIVKHEGSSARKD